MELTEDIIAQIGAYLTNQMSESERQRFEHQVQQNPELRQEVLLQKELKKGFEVLATKDKFRQIHQQLTEQGQLSQPSPALAKPDPQVIDFPVTPTLKRNRWYPLAVAASLVILLGTGWFVWQTPQFNGSGATPGEQLAERFLSKPVKLTPVAEDDPDLLGASNEESQTTRDSVQLYQALQLLEKDQTRQAITELRSLTEEVRNHWDASAQWYLALAYLKNSQPDQARTLLQTIENQSGHPYQSEAQQLSSELLKNESK